jgi:hypothetical protein
MRQTAPGPHAAGVDQIGVIAEQADNGRQLDYFWPGLDYNVNSGYPTLGRLGSLIAGQRARRRGENIGGRGMARELTRY